MTSNLSVLSESIVSGWSGATDSIKIISKNSGVSVDKRKCLDTGN